MSGGKMVVSEVKSMAEDEPEEGEIQDDDGSLEDVSSDEDVSSVCRKRNRERFYGNKFNVYHVRTEYAAQSSRPHNSSAHKSYKRKRVSSIIEEKQQRLSPVKYRKETNKSTNGVYHVALNTVAVDDRRKENNFVDRLNEYQFVMPKQDIKDEDIVQEKENRSDCQKETKVKRMIRRKQRHSLLNSPEPRPSISSDIKTDSNRIIGPEEEERKKKDSCTKLGTKSKSSHSKKRCYSPKREKHRCSKKKDGRKYLSKTIEKSDCPGNGAHGSSLLMRLQAMMTVNMSARKERTPVVSVKKKDEDIVKSQELDNDLRTNSLPSLDAMKLDDENEKDCSEKAEIVGETNQNHLSGQTEDIKELPDTRKNEPLVITIEDSDSELSVPAKMLEYDSPEKVNKKGEMKAVESETGTKGTEYEEEDEDLVQLRLLALQSHRRKETSKPRVEDDEVMQLRLAALKSAIIKKCQVRKQRGITLKSKKMNALDSPGLSDLEKSNIKDDLGEEILRPETASMEAVQGEPDETTALVDMDLSHTDDESESQSEMIIGPVDIPLPGNCESKFLPLIPEDYSTQNVPCINVPLVKTVHEDNLVHLKGDQKDDVVNAWSPAVTMYSSPDLESCQLSGTYNSNVQIPSLNSVGYSNSQVQFPSSSPFPQQQLYHELYQSDNSFDHPSTHLDVTTSETNTFDLCASPGVPGSFVSSDVNSSSFTYDAMSVSMVEPHMVSANTFIARTESPFLETNSIGLDIPRANSAPATEDPQFPGISSITHTTDPEVPGTDSLTPVQFCAVDCGAGSCQNRVRIRNIHMDLKNSVSLKKLPPATHMKPTGKAESDPSAVCAVPTGLFSSSLNPQNQELKRTNAEDLCRNCVSVPARETVENRADCSVQENSSEPENIDLSSMIILDEVGQCSSPETKVEVSSEPVASKNEGMSRQCDKSSLNVDEDEEVLRAKVLTTLARKPSTSAAFLTSKPKNVKDNAVSDTSKVSSKQQIETSAHSLPVLPNHISPSSSNSVQPVQKTSVSHKKGKMPSELSVSLHELKQWNNVYQRVPNKKVEHSQSSLSSYNKGNIIRTKYWKRSVKKGFSGSNTKQILTVVHRNPVPMKQLTGPSAVARKDPPNMDLELKTRTAQFKPVDNTVSRVVFRPRVPKPTMIQVTVPTTNVDDKQRKRKIAASVVSSVAPVQPAAQRFVIRLGDDSDSPDEEEKIHPMSQTPKRRCVIKNNSSLSLWPVSSSNVRTAPCDQVVNCDSNIASSLSHPLSDKQNTVPVLTQHVTVSRIADDFEKSVDIFLKQQRKSQEATAKEMPDENVGGKTNQVVSSATPLAVRHLPSSQQEEYRRLKQQIAELEEQRRRSQQQQQHQQEQQQQKQLPLLSPPPPPLSTNMTNSESYSRLSSPSRTAALSSSSNHPLSIAHTNTTDGKKGAPQSSVTSAERGSDLGKILRMQSAQNKRPSNSVILKEAASDKGIANAASPAPVISEEEQGETLEKANDLTDVVSQEEESVMESKDGVFEVHDVSMLSSCQHDCSCNSDESLEQKEAKLAEIEHQLLSKRYEVLDELTNMTTLLCQIERERATEEECLKDLHRIRGELLRVEERLSQQKELLSHMRSDMAKSHRLVAQGRAQCIGLSKTCLSLGIGVKGHSYKVPAGGAELMNRKLQQVAAQTRRMSRKKEHSDNSDENRCGSDMPSFLTLQVPVQDKKELRTACIAVDSSEDNSKACSSSTMDVNAESISLIQSPENGSMLFSNSHISQSKSANSSDTLDCKLTELPSKPSVQSPLSEMSETGTSVAAKLDSCVQVESDDVEVDRSQPAVTDVERMGTDVLGASDMKMVGIVGNSKETVLRHLSEYRSPLEHLYSERGKSEAGSEWCGPLDPLAILCPYELMGRCQDEDCSYQHPSKSTVT